jgi:hypothetical protein
MLTNPTGTRTRRPTSTAAINHNTVAAPLLNATRSVGHPPRAWDSSSGRSGPACGSWSRATRPRWVGGLPQLPPSRTGDRSVRRWTSNLFILGYPVRTAPQTSPFARNIARLQGRMDGHPTGQVTAPVEEVTGDLAQAAEGGPLGARHRQTATGEGVQLPGPAWSTDPRSRNASADRVDRDPTSVDRGVDLDRSPRPSPSDGHRRRRETTVPLSPGLEGPA